MNEPLSSYHDPRALSKFEINDSGDKRKKYWEDFYSKNSRMSQNMNSSPEKENMNSYYEIPKNKLSKEKKNKSILAPVNLNRFIANDRRESWGFPVNLKSNLKRNNFSKEKQKEIAKEKIQNSRKFSNKKNSFKLNLNRVKEDSDGLFTLGSKQMSPKSIFRSNTSTNNSHLIPVEISTKYSNNDPRIKSSFKIYTQEKLQKNGTIFTKIHCEGKNKISVANKANIFNFIFSRKEQDVKGVRWGKGIFVMHGNYQEVFGLWKLKPTQSDENYLVLVKEDGNVKLIDFSKRKNKSVKISKFCYNPFDYSNYRNSVVISEELRGIEAKRIRNPEDKNLKPNSTFKKEKKLVLMLRETENKVSIFTKNSLDPRKKYSKLGICNFENGLCIQSMFFINKKDEEAGSNHYPGIGGSKGTGYAWFFFKNGMYSVELVKPFVKENIESQFKKPINLMKYSPRKEIVIGNNSARLKTLIPPASLPYFNPENSEIMSSLITEDQKWFFLSIYQKAFNVNFLVLFKRKGQELEFYSKLNVQNLQGKIFFFIFFKGSESYVSHLKMIKMRNSMNNSSEKQPGDCYILGFKSSPSVAYVFKVTKTTIQRVCAPVFLDQGKH